LEPRTNRARRAERNLLGYNGSHQHRKPIPLDTKPEMAHFIDKRAKNRIGSAKSDQGLLNLRSLQCHVAKPMELLGKTDGRRSGVSRRGDACRAAAYVIVRTRRGRANRPIATWF